MKTRFVVLCSRGASSVFGRKTALLKDLDGQVKEFETLELARKEAQRLNAETSIFADVHYTATTDQW